MLVTYALSNNGAKVPKSAMPCRLFIFLMIFQAVAWNSFFFNGQAPGSWNLFQLCNCEDAYIVFM